MAAPAVAVVVAFLTGAPVGATAAPWLAGALRVEAGAAVAYADLSKACPVAEPLIARAAARQPKLKGLARFAALTRVVCADVMAADTPINQAKLAADVLAALAAASGPAPAGVAPAVSMHRGR